MLGRQRTGKGGGCTRGRGRGGAGYGGKGKKIHNYIHTLHVNSICVQVAMGRLHSFLLRTIASSQYIAPTAYSQMLYIGIHTHPTVYSTMFHTV